MDEVNFDRGWEILQDVHDLGESMRLFERSGNIPGFGAQISEWEKLERLGHLQTALSPTPYFGRELRHFNQAPWWYRLEFPLPREAEGKMAALRFDAVDYYCKVWLNGKYLGSHQGYATPFEFDATQALLRNEPNLLVVKVWSPWDTEIRGGNAENRFWHVVRGMAKGTYEHDDTFVARDVNPVGIWGAVRLLLHDGVRFDGRPRIVSGMADGGRAADVHVTLPVHMDRESFSGTARCRILDGKTGATLASAEEPVALKPGCASPTVSLRLNNPKQWSAWDRGEQQLYRASVEIREAGKSLCRVEERFGIRSIALNRTGEETSFHLNGRKLFIRGTAYFPDVYVSELYEARYRRDMERVKSAGFNAIRLHVHTPREVLLDICDELGIAVLQDFDINWTHPEDEEWGNAAAGIFGELIRAFRNHPSIIAWIATNEPSGNNTGSIINISPGPQLMETAQRLDPDRPVIRGSGAYDDVFESGDTHNYIGSLNGQDTHYTDIFGKAENGAGYAEKLNTEFGFDAPGSAENLRKISRLYERLKPLGDDGIREVQYYQYRLLKYYVEHYRAMKYAPCSGYFQFMFIDLCPQSFYGVYDWWGMPKEGLRALQESNGPIGVFMLYKDAPGRLFAVNDTLDEYAGCTAAWTATDDEGNTVAAGRKTIDLPADSLVEIGELKFVVSDEKKYSVYLSVRDAAGKLLAQNSYRDAFHHPAHPEGHPQRMSHELGMRLYWA